MNAYVHIKTYISVYSGIAGIIHNHQDFKKASYHKLNVTFLYSFFAFPAWNH